MPGTATTTAATRALIVTMYGEGAPIKKITDAADVSPRTVYRVLQEEGVTRDRTRRGRASRIAVEGLDDVAEDRLAEWALNRMADLDRELVRTQHQLDAERQRNRALLAELERRIADE